MQTLQDIFSFFKLNAAKVGRLSSEAKRAAVDCGKKGVIKELPPDTWNLFDDMSGKVWYSSFV